MTRLAQYAPEAGFSHAAQLFALLLFGAALWWLVMETLISLASIKSHTLEFGVAWWSFVFPTGFLAILSGSLDFPPAGKLFPSVWALMAALWTACILKTLHHGIGGLSLFREKGIKMILKVSLALIAAISFTIRIFTFS